MIFLNRALVFHNNYINIAYQNFLLYEKDLKEKELTVFFYKYCTNS